MANPITKILTNVVDTLGNKIGALPSTSKSIADYSDIINQGVRLDTADAYKNLFHVDTEFAKGYGGELKSGSLKYGSDDMPPSLTDKELIDAQNEIKGLTQDYLKDLPDDLTVYRYGDLDNETGVSSFTLNPNYNVDSSLPWQKRLQSPMQTFKVKKEDVLASPDINAFFGGGRGFDEQEVIIGNDKVGALPSSNFDDPTFLDARTGESTVVTRENKIIKHPTEFGAYLIKLNDKEYKIAKHLDDNERHAGEWSIFEKVANQHTGDEWGWIDTVYSRKYALERLKDFVKE